MRGWNSAPYVGCGIPHPLKGEEFLCETGYRLLTIVLIHKLAESTLVSLGIANFVSLNFNVTFSDSKSVIVIGNQLQASISGVDVAGATFLLNDVILTRGVVFAYSAFFRSNKPIRFQIWRPLTLNVNEKSFRLISETRVLPSVLLDREDVSQTYNLLNRP